MKIWQKQKFESANGIVKKYKLCGVTVLRKEKNPLCKKWQFLGVKIRHRTKGYVFKPDRKYDKNFSNVKQNVISIETIKRIIDSPAIKIISFDIFDTLLIRPVINPTDIFYLIEEKLKNLYGIEFVKYRLHAESELKNPYASIDDIYNHIQKKYKFDKNTVDIMKNEELECEKTLLSRRDDIFKLYDYAVKKGKKVIAVSDMYLSSEFLTEVLIEKGYDKIAAVYVSNEYKKRKDDGTLYGYVADKEDVLPQNILHIGDNYESDYLRAIESNFTAVYYPSIKDMVFAESSIYRKVWEEGISNDAICRILIGFTLNNYFKDINKISDYPAVFPDFNSFVKLGLAPVIFYIAASIANNKDIQNNYKTIFFASRDGYLPKLAYDIVAKHNDILPSKYVYAGRRAYFSCFTDDFVSYAENLRPDIKNSYSIINLLNAFVFDDELKNRIIDSLSESEKKLDLNCDKEKFIAVLRRFDVLNDYLAKHTDNAYRYYNSIKTESDREIIFDCGYSGSVSEALTPIMNKPVDKIYLWETEANRKKDMKNNTKTYVLFGKEQLFYRLNLLYEELFSPLEGGCLGFDTDKSAILEKCCFSKEMQKKYDVLNLEIRDFMQKAVDCFKGYFLYLNVKDSVSLQEMIYYSIKESPYQEVSNLDEISFPDPVFFSNTKTLSYKIQETLGYKNVYDHTGFDNPLKVVKLKEKLPDKNFKIGIHCHLYNVHLYQEILGYLKDFPAKFDLIITICDANKQQVLENIFCKFTIPNLEKLIIKVVENRGRDAAPWLVGTADLQKNYDLFCHIHGKISSYSLWGDDWRRYLLDNLIEKGAVADVLNLFADNERLGCVFPNVFTPLKNMCIANNVNQEGEFGEIKMICDLLRKMKLNVDFTRKDLFFSEGTMMWYRPQALKPLFDLRLGYDDFPAEPIGVGGTIAHAIERLPAFVCTHNNYDAKCFVKHNR